MCSEMLHTNLTCPNIQDKLTSTNRRHTHRRIFIPVTMIISASRRTDIPAFYSEWFINRIRAGYCTVPNPFNTKQVSWIDLSPDQIDVIVFWTRNPRPLFPYLKELDRLGYRFYFQYTVMANPTAIDPKSPPTETAIKASRDLSELVGAKRLIWRYDPIVFTPLTPPTYHQEAYAKIAQNLIGCTNRSVISLVDIYSKAKKRIGDMAKKGATIQVPATVDPEAFNTMLFKIVGLARENGMKISSCAEDIDLTGFGIQPGKCVDDQYIQELFGIDVIHKKDPSQRDACGCVVSKDIGMYDSCLFGCQYCYATSSFERARKNHADHNPQSPSLIGWYESEKSPVTRTTQQKPTKQLQLWGDQGKNKDVG